MKKLPAILFAILSAGSLSAQHGMSMYHLRGAVFQNTQFNAVQMPEFGDFFLGLPVISGINLHAGSKLSYNELFTKQEDTTIVDISKAITHLSTQNGIYAHVNLNLFHGGIRLPNRAVVSLFANERIEADVLFPEQAVRLLWEGNASVLEERVKIGRFAISANHFREIGLGYAGEISDKNLRYGVRLKYLQGIFNASLPGNLRADILTEYENNQINVTLRNAAFRTSGVEMLRESEVPVSHLLTGGGNSGVGLDIGFEYQHNSAYGFALGINDIGFINWKADIKNYSLNDTTFRYVGSALKNAVNIRDSLEAFVDKLKINGDNTDPYTAMLPPRIFGSFILYDQDRGFDIISTFSTRIIQGQPRFSFGVGGRFNIGSRLTASVNVNKLDQQLFNVGAAVAAQVSAVQFYLASDHLIGYSVPDMDGVDLRLGINFIFGKNDGDARGADGRMYRDSRKSGSAGQSGYKRKGVKTPKYGFFLGETVKLKGKESIYQIIKKQEKRKVSTGSKEPKFNKKVPRRTTSKKPKFRSPRQFGGSRTAGAVSDSGIEFNKKKIKSRRSTIPKFSKKNIRN